MVVGSSGKMPACSDLHRCFVPVLVFQRFMLTSVSDSLQIQYVKSHKSQVECMGKLVIYES